MSLRNVCFKQVARNFSGFRTVARAQNRVFDKPNLKTEFLQFCLAKRFKSLKCWQCGIERENLAELFCSQCNFIQNPQQNANYFKLFGLETEFEVNSKDLTRKYREMQSLLHPDKFSNRSSEEKDISADYSSLVNEAYKILQSPLQRAIHLLSLKGQNIEEDQKVEDPAFLMEIMELNEEVESADTDEKLVKLNEKSKQDLGKITQEISTAFQRSEIDRAKQLIIKMKYYSSVSKHINDLMREKGITN